MQKNLTRYWLLIGISALAVAGLFAIILVAARTPQLAMFPGLFHSSLVVHVDLSVLVWFLCIACMMWSRQTANSKPLIPLMEEAALICFALGTAGITLSPLDPGAEALMSNYIPVMHSPIFFLGLMLVACGTALMAARSFCSRAWQTPTDFGLFVAAAIALFALAAFYVSARAMPPVIEGTQYYEMAFWAGGHVLQFTHTQMMMIAWLMLVASVGVGASEKKFSFFTNTHTLTILFSIGLLAAFSTPLAYMHDIASPEHRLFFTHQMIWFGALAPVLLLIYIVPALWRSRHERKSALWSTLFMSVLLFVVGGALGEMIEGQNVVIPAHYHGSIVGVTLAFMGLAYLFLPTFGYRDPANWKLAYWQPFVYGGGQLLHISGLAWSGGYGVLRKTPGALDTGMSAATAAMGLMGMGGLLSVIGGLMFVIVAARAIFYKD